MSNDIINFYELKEIDELKTKYYNPNYNKVNMAHPFRCAIIGSSGSGKTNCLLNFIALSSGTFGHITVVYKESEPLYELLDKKLKSKNISFFTSLDDVPAPNKIEKGKQHLMIFDDQVVEKNQSKIMEYAIRGRKCSLGVSIIIISQSYYAIPKLIRQQLGFLLLVKLSAKRDINMIMKDTGGLGIDDDKIFEKLYMDATKKPMNFLKIDINNPDTNKKFSINFNNFIKIKNDDDEY